MAQMLSLQFVDAENAHLNAIAEAQATIQKPWHSHFYRPAQSQRLAVF